MQPTVILVHAMAWHTRGLNKYLCNEPVKEQAQWPLTYTMKFNFHSHPITIIISSSHLNTARPTGKETYAQVSLTLGLMLHKLHLDAQVTHLFMQCHPHFLRTVEDLPSSSCCEETAASHCWEKGNVKIRILINQAHI